MVTSTLIDLPIREGLKNRFCCIARDLQLMLWGRHHHPVILLPVLYHA